MSWPDPDPSIEPFPGAGGRVLLGYTTLREGLDFCPFCSLRLVCIEDDGDPETYLIRCWCRATTRVDQNDEHLLKLIKEDKVPRPRRI